MTVTRDEAQRQLCYEIVREEKRGLAFLHQQLRTGNSSPFYRSFYRFTPAFAREHLKLIPPLKASTRRFLAMYVAMELGPDAAPVIPDLLKIIQIGAPDEKTLAVKCFEDIGPFGKEARPVLENIKNSSDDPTLRSLAASSLTVLDYSPEQFKQWRRQRWPRH